MEVMERKDKKDNKKEQWQEMMVLVKAKTVDAFHSIWNRKWLCKYNGVEVKEEEEGRARRKGKS